MNELEKLKPEVREALEDIDDCMRMDIKVVPVGALGVIRAELVRLARDNEALRSKCNVIMSGSTQHLGRAERAESELAALKRRIAEAPTAVVKQFYANLTLEPFDPPAWALRDKPVRLLLDE